jgi:hypothetical protein
MPAQGTPGTSDRGAMELNKLDLWCLNLEACLWRCLLMVLFIEKHVKYRKMRRRRGKLWPLTIFFFFKGEIKERPFGSNTSVSRWL